MLILHTFDGEKTEVDKAFFWIETQKLFKPMRIRFIKHEFI